MLDNRVNEVLSKVNDFWDNSDNGVIELDSGKEGDSVTICTLTHGNEIGGILGLYDVFFQQNIKPVRGKIRLVLVNHEAVLMTPDHESDILGRRFVEEDMNRLWEFTTDTKDSARARELIPFITDTDFLLDLHSTGNPSVPMGLPYPDLRSIEIARQIQTDYVITNLVTLVRGKALCVYAVEHSKKSRPVSMAVELGQHSEFGAEEVSSRTIMQFLRLTKAIEEDPLIISPAPKAIKIFKTLRNRTMDYEFTYTAGKAHSFDYLEKGQEIARDEGIPVITDKDCLIVLPTDPKRLTIPGQETGYLGTLVD